MTRHIRIEGRSIGPDHQPYIVAELSANHRGHLDSAFAVMEAAMRAGADAVKLQTYTAETMTIDHAGPDFQISGGLWDGRLLFDLYQEAHTPWAWHADLFAKARELDLAVFSTPFDATAVDLLESLGVPAYKIASFELVDVDLIRRVAATGKPVIMSTGMASIAEIDEAVEAFTGAGGREFMLLHCISGYPTAPEQSNLRRIPRLAERYGCPIGLSDHTLGTEVAVAAIALGACFVEKHVTLRRSDGGPDAAFSLEPDELATLCRTTRVAYAALGSGDEARAAAEKGSMVFRRSIYAVRDIAAGEEFTRDNIRVIRPGFGLAPKEMPHLLGARAATSIPRGTRMSWDLVA
jgi:pseudaminic acid synthase